MVEEMVQRVSPGGRELTLLDSVLEVCTAGVAVLDSDGGVIGADVAFARLTGRERRHVQGLRVSDLFRSDPPLTLYDESACSSGWQVEIPQPSGDPPVRARLTVARRRSPQGATIGHIAQLHPLAASTGDESPPVRHSGAVPPKTPQHQLRNVMTVIAGNVEIIDSMNRDQTLRERIALIQGAVSSALDIMAQMGSEPNGPPPEDSAPTTQSVPTLRSSR